MKKVHIELRTRWFNYTRADDISLLTVGRWTRRRVGRVVGWEGSAPRGLVPLLMAVTFLAVAASIAVAVHSVLLLLVLLRGLLP